MRDLFFTMVERGASDAVLVVGRPADLNVDGVHTPWGEEISPAYMDEFLHYLLDEHQQAQLNRERKLMFANTGGVRNASFRITLYYERGRLAASIRQIPTLIPSLDQLDASSAMEQFALAKRGLVLICGASGQGKSTTLAAMLATRARLRAGHIQTIEDPLEYWIPHGMSVVSQREVGWDAPSWEEALSDAVRMNLDCLAIGEIQTERHAALALRFAMAGHLAMATFHASNVQAAVTRFIDMADESDQGNARADVAECLQAVICQRLVRLKDGSRRAVFEVLTNVRPIADLIRDNRDGEILDYLRRNQRAGLEPFERNLANLCETGLIDTEAAMRASDAPAVLYEALAERGLARVDRTLDIRVD